MASNRTTSHNLDDWILVLGGQRITGFGDGDAIKITMLSDAWTDKAGADGEVMRSKTNDRRATLEVAVTQGSLAMAQLNALFAADEMTGAGSFALLLVDKRGTSRFSAADCWIVKSPDRTIGKEAADVTWMLRAGHLVATHGGQREMNLP